MRSTAKREIVKRDGCLSLSLWRCKFDHSVEILIIDGGGGIVAWTGEFVLSFLYFSSFLSSLEIS